MEGSPKLELKHELGEGIPAEVSLDSIPQYLGKRVVIEYSGQIGEGVSSGDFTQYDGRVITLENYQRHGTTIDLHLSSAASQPGANIRDPDSISYQIPKRTVAVSQVGSIMSLDDLVDHSSGDEDGS